MLRQVVRPYVRATPSLQGAQLYLLAKVIIFHQFSTFLCLLFEGQHLLKQMAEKDWEAVKKEVLTIVSRRYLEPSLKRVDVIRDVTLMKHTLAGTFITQVGFYKLVNAFRVRHYERLMETSNSNLSQDMAAELCGFKNRWALSNARKRLEGFDYSLIEEYVS